MLQVRVLSLRPIIKENVKRCSLLLLYFTNERTRTVGSESTFGECREPTGPKRVERGESSPVTPTRKSLWSSTPHRDFSIKCYKVAKKTPDGIDYEITIDGKNRYATVAMTKYYDETEEPILLISLGTHPIYFYAE